MPFDIKAKLFTRKITPILCMAGTSYQSDLIKLYLVAFIRAPEKSGLEY